MEGGGPFLVRGLDSATTKSPIFTRPLHKSAYYLLPGTSNETYFSKIKTGAALWISPACAGRCRPRSADKKHADRAYFQQTKNLSPGEHKPKFFFFQEEKLKKKTAEAQPTLRPLGMDYGGLFLRRWALIFLAGERLTFLGLQSPSWGQFTEISSSSSPKRDCGSKRVNPFSTVGTAVPFWGQTSLNPSNLSPKRDCSMNMY